MRTNRLFHSAIAPSLHAYHARSDRVYKHEYARSITLPPMHIVCVAAGTHLRFTLFVVSSCVSLHISVRFTHAIHAAYHFFLCIVSLCIARVAGGRPQGGVGKSLVTSIMPRARSGWEASEKDRPYAVSLHAYRSLSADNAESLYRRIFFICSVRIST